MCNRVQVGARFIWKPVLDTRAAHEFTGGVSTNKQRVGACADEPCLVRSHYFGQLPLGEVVPAPWATHAPWHVTHKLVRVLWVLLKLEPANSACLNWQ